ncbi:MAG: hypothetical protein J6A00_06470 [Bacteroides sp.]|nr:hypothetical protein [Bacteroides sp.]
MLKKGAFNMSLRSDPYKALKYDYTLYQMEETAKAIPDARSEYERLRHQIDIRLRRFERSGLTDTAIYAEHKNVFEDVNTLNNSEVYERIPEMARFLTDVRSTVTGYRETERKAVRTLRDQGLTFVNKKNYKDFTDFMEWARSSKTADLFYTVMKAPKTGDTEERELDLKQLKEAFRSWLKGIK